MIFEKLKPGFPNLPSLCGKTNFLKEIASEKAILLESHTQHT